MRKKKSVDHYSPSRRLHQVRALLNLAGGVSVYDIAERLKVSSRTASRYLSALHLADEPIYEDTETQAPRKVWRLAAGARSNTITMSTQQMFALFLSRRVFDFLAGTGFKDDLDDVFARLEVTLQKKDYVKTRDLELKIYDVNEAPHIYEDRAEDVDDIVTGLIENQRLRVRHDSVGKGKTPFVVDPYTLLIYKKGLYLVCNSHHHGEIRTFALDGFRSTERLKDQRFEYPADYHPTKRFGGNFGLFGGAPQLVRIFFQEKVSRFVRRRQWHPTQKVQKVPGGIELTMTVAGLVEVASWVLSFGEKAVVLQPESLREQIAGELARAARNYASPVPKS
jgi:proteasome accessory factor B